MLIFSTYVYVEVMSLGIPSKTITMTDRLIQLCFFLSFSSSYENFLEYKFYKISFSLFVFFKFFLTF